jgi:hypothetical protein
MTERPNNITPTAEPEMTAAFLLGYRVHFSWLNNCNEIIQFRCLDPDISKQRRGA